MNSEHIEWEGEDAEARISLNSTACMTDCSELPKLHQRSQSLHQPWSFPPLTHDGCMACVQR